MQIHDVLITGGAGFIGSHLVDAYLSAGARVTVIDDLSTGERSNVNPAAELIVADVRDESIDAIFERRRFDVVNHHAAQVDVRISVSRPDLDAEMNVVASVRMLKNAAHHGVKKFIFASSGGVVYGEPRFVPQTEEHPFAPISPYGCAKLSVEHYLEYFREVVGLSTVALRYANVYGPRQSSKGEAGVVAIFADRLLCGEDVTINGDGEQTRDFVFIDDVVAASMAATEHDLEGAFNVGTGTETSVNKLTSALQKAIGSNATIHHGPAKVGEQRRSVLDGTKLRRVAGLAEPLLLEEGLRRTIAWYRR